MIRRCFRVGVPLSKKMDKYVIVGNKKLKTDHGTDRNESFYKEVRGDLFSCPANESLAHCISRDVRMGKGIAVLFRNKFGGVQELKDQGKKVGDVAVLQRDQRHIYYLITKEAAWHKPTYSSLMQSLQAMKSHAQQHTVKGISMPRIGCGLDGLEWEEVMRMVKEVFGGSGINITVYSL